MSLCLLYILLLVCGSHIFLQPNFPHVFLILRILILCGLLRGDPKIFGETASLGVSKFETSYGVVSGRVFKILNRRTHDHICGGHVWHVISFSLVCDGTERGIFSVVIGK